MSTTDPTDVLALLGPSGVAVLLGVAWLLLCAKFPKLRRRTARALHRAARAAWRFLWRELPLLFHPHRPSRDERRVMRRMHPHHWKRHAHERGLDGTLTTRPRLSSGGVSARIRLDGQWTPGKLRKAEDHVRALLGLRAGWRVEITTGKRGGWADITVRTRSAADGIDLTGWTPGCPWGVDTVTGEPVMVPLGRRMLIAGTSGAGKSWSTRALLAEGSEADDHRLVVIDPKRVEAINWEHRARVAITPDEVLDVVIELVAEMYERLALVPRGRDTIAISEARPRITVFVDEGAEVISMARQKGYAAVLEGLVTLARMGRAAEIIVIWATQKPTMDKTGGIDPQISAQITYRAALALSTSGEDRVVFGEDATEKGWHAHELPMPGVAMLRSGPNAKPHPIKTRAFSPADVIALPDRPAWGRDRVERPVAVDEQPVDAAPGARDRILSALADGITDVQGLVDAAGLSRATVNRVLSDLVKTGDALRTDRGRYAIPEPATV